MATITFKTKVRKIDEGDGTTSEYIDYKRDVSRRDCDLKPHQHTYYNSDLFPGMLRSAYATATNGREWIRLKDLPSCVTVDTSKFLATVTVTLPPEFMR